MQDLTELSNEELLSAFAAVLILEPDCTIEGHYQYQNKIHVSRPYYKEILRRLNHEIFSMG